ALMLSFQLLCHTAGLMLVMGPMAGIGAYCMFMVIASWCKRPLQGSLGTHRTLMYNGIAGLPLGIIFLFSIMASLLGQSFWMPVHHGSHFLLLQVCFAAAMGLPAFVVA